MTLINSHNSCNFASVSVEKGQKLRVRFNPRKENRVHQTKVSKKTDKDGFSPAVFRSKLEQKIPFSECLVWLVRILFSMAKSMLRMGSCVRLCCYKILFLCTTCGGGSPSSAVSLQVAPFLKDCKGRSYRHDLRVGQTKRKTSEFIVI